MYLSLTSCIFLINSYFLSTSNFPRLKSTKVMLQYPLHFNSLGKIFIRTNYIIRNDRHEIRSGTIARS